MPIAVSKIYQIAINKGAQVLDNGNAYICRQSKYNPNRYIQRVIAPNGNYTIQVSENGTVTKRIYKYFQKGTSTLTDSWDFVQKRGLHLSSVIINEGKSIMSRVFKKVDENKINSDGLIYIHHFGKKDTYTTDIKTLNGITSVPKPFSTFGWLNEQFYKYFNK